MVPIKVVDAIRAGHYVPYSKLTAYACLAATTEQDHLTVSANGKIIASSSLSRGDERQMSYIDWSLASDIMTEKVREYHGDARTSDYMIHHQNVKVLAGHYGWHIGWEYNIC